MDDRDIRRVFDQVRPTPEQEEAMLSRLLETTEEVRPMRKKRTIVLILAAALVLTACTAGAVGLTLRQAEYRYFDSGEEAAQAATQAALEAGDDTAAVGYADPGPISDYPAQEPWDLEAEMGYMAQVYAHQYGGPEDGWTEMCAGGDSPTDRVYYQADALSGLAEFWPVETPDLAWLEETYVPLPGGQCFLDWGSDFMPAASSLNFWGEYQSPEGAPVSLAWTFQRRSPVSDSFTVLDDRYQVEEYTTADGCAVTIEWFTSQNGQSQFTTWYGYGYADFSMSGAELEAEDVYALLDHMNLSALANYQPETGQT